jgi:hypothetical protein
METPNPKLQTPNKLQAPKPKLSSREDDGRVAVSPRNERAWSLELGVSLVFGVWSLGFLPLGRWVIESLVTGPSVLFMSKITDQ